METSAVLASAQDRVVSDVVASLERRDQARHDASSPEQRRRDVRHLFELVLRCVHEGSAESIITPSEQIAADRFAGGADLAEVQGAFNILEEVLWRHVAGTFAGDQRVEALGLVNAALGAGKDALARTYVALASRAPPAGPAARGRSRREPGSHRGHPDRGSWPGGRRRPDRSTRASRRHHPR